jgi:hypothetical protein
LQVVSYISAVPLAEALDQALTDLVRQAVSDALAAQEIASGWLDVSRAADYLSMSAKALRHAEARGHVKAHRTPTGRLLFRPSELDEFVLGGERH